MVGRKCVLMKQQCILEVSEQFYFQFKKTKPKTNQKHPLNPLLIWTYLWMSIWPPTYQSSFDIYFWCWVNTLLQLDFFIQATGITGTERSHGAMTCKQMVWVQQEKVGWKSRSDSGLGHCWRLVPGLCVLEEICGLSFFNLSLSSVAPRFWHVIYNCAFCYSILICCFF